MSPVARVGAAWVWVWVLWAAMAAPAPAAKEQAAEATAGAAPTNATVTFTWVPPSPPGAAAHHYTVTVQSNGGATYLSTGPLLPDSTGGDDYKSDFMISLATRQQIFTLAQQTDYFHGEFDFKKHRIANSGPKTLSYKSAELEGSTAYNWSENQAIQQLTHVFQALVNTQEAGRRMLYYRRFDKLGLEPELSQLEELAKSGDAIELQSIGGLLEQISADHSVLHVARARADRLLKLAAGGGKPEATAEQ